MACPGQTLQLFGLIVSCKEKSLGVSVAKNNVDARMIEFSINSFSFLAVLLNVFFISFLLANIHFHRLTNMLLGLVCHMNVLAHSPQGRWDTGVGRSSSIQPKTRIFTKAQLARNIKILNKFLYIFKCIFLSENLTKLRLIYFFGDFIKFL